MVINAGLKALNPESRKHKVILLVGTVYSELTTPTGLGPRSCSWTPGRKTQTPMKQIPQVSSLSCAQVEETRVDNASYKSFKEEDVREDIDRTQAAVSDCNLFRGSLEASFDKDWV